MPHPALHAHVHLAAHPDHSSAVVATITGSGASTARALLSVQGFRPTGEQTMVLARIDHEEHHYADQAARALREHGAAVDITPGLQADIDTEWTWVNYALDWLNRDEIREVSNEAQKIHDDIVSGRLTIHLHADDGWTIVAVGSYRHGQSIHLHGENHLRQVALVYDKPAEAIAAFHQFYGDTVRPGPAPATDTERAAAQALDATAEAPPSESPATAVSETATPAQQSEPGYARDLGDHEALLNDFLEMHGEWEKYRTWDDNTTVVSHESLTLRVMFVHEAYVNDIAWTIAAYESPVGARTWHATASTGTPAEVMRTLLDHLASEDAYAAGHSTPVSEQAIAEATKPLTEAGWKQTVEGSWIRWAPPNGDPVGLQFDAFAARFQPESSLATWTLWGGNTLRRPTWTVNFSPHTPVGLLQHLTTELGDAYDQSVRQAPTPPPNHQTSHTQHPGDSKLPPSPAPPTPSRSR
ncbi:DUF317 domain-containing protein [Streptomyces sp. NPDC102274]|uniref:DUF317 domain-containing protein n=1 Tax=Streptomyces sp. NPDC102274 TaxID=3366151 RepID=UPI00380173F5